MPTGELLLHTASHTSDAGDGAGIQNGDICLCVCGRAELCIFRWPVAAGSATFGETGSGGAASRTATHFYQVPLRGVRFLPHTPAPIVASVPCLCARQSAVLPLASAANAHLTGRGGAGLGRGLGVDSSSAPAP